MITITNRRILVDGTNVIILAGEVHYFRLARNQWADRLDKLRETGCTCVSSYIPWLFHELPDGSLDLSGRTRPERDLGAFIDLCAEKGLTFLARPGPFVMAELKNEGLPYRVYREHPEIIPPGWSGQAPRSAVVDYLAPAFLAEVDRWYAAVMPVLAQRVHGRPGLTGRPDGNVVAVQLDNEIGMLAWVTNSPDLSTNAVAELEGWARARYGDHLRTRYPIDWTDPSAWVQAVRSPAESWAAALRVDLGRFSRDRFARYVDQLATMAARHGVDSVPLLINVHGTEGGNGVPFAIGVSQLYRTYSKRDGFVAGSDHYLGDLSLDTTGDLHFVNAIMAATNGPEQPVTSLEFEAGTGDYTTGLDRLYDPRTIDVKTRLFVAQGNRLINFYLLAGGINPPLDEPVGDGNDRISFTGERHGQGAPIGSVGERGLTFQPLAEVCRAVNVNACWLADMDEEHDDLAVAFWPDAFMTEYHHPGSDIMTEIVDDLSAHRGPGHGKALWRSLLFAGYRFGAVDIQDPTSRLPTVLAVSSGTIMDKAVQQRLAAYVRAGGGLLLTGRLPERDLLGGPCTVLADALGLRASGAVTAGPGRFPSVRGVGLLAGLPETRVDALTTLTGSAEPLLTDIDGHPCAVTVAAGAGRAAVVTAALPARPATFAALATWLGAGCGLALGTDVPGVVATTTATPDGQRMLHVLNPTGYRATVTVDVPGSAALLDLPLLVPPRSGWMLPMGVIIPGTQMRILSANAEVSSIDKDSVTFTAGLGNETVVWLDHQRPQRYAGPGDAPLRVALPS